MHTTHDLLDADQERELARAVEAGLYARHLVEERGEPDARLLAVVEDGRLAWERLWLANTGLVRLLARRYGRGRRDIEDELVQEGFVALAECLQRYDWARGLRLSTFAWHGVRHRMAHAMRQRSTWERSTTPERPGLDPAAPEPEPEPDTRGLLVGLGRLEQTVLLARARGLAQREVAQQLGLGVSTVRSLEERALRRARSRLQLVA